MKYAELLVDNDFAIFQPNNATKTLLHLESVTGAMTSLKLSRPYVLIIAIFLIALPACSFAASVTLNWKANPESDISHYSVYYGSSSRVYGSPEPVGKATSYTVKGLTENKTYFFALTATDTAGNESGFSSEAAAKATNISSTPPPSSDIPSEVNIGADKSSPVPTETPVTLSASASGGTGSYEYRFWIYGPSTGNQWKMIRDWSSQSTHSWTTPSQAGTYSLGVWAKNIGDNDSRIAYKELANYKVEPSSTGLDPVPSSVSISVDENSPVASGTIVTLGSLAMGGSGNYEYRFWAYGPSTGNTWKVIREWGASSFAWRTPSQAGTYRLGVWAKNKGDNDSRIAYKELANYKVEPSSTGLDPVPSKVYISTNKASPAYAKTQVKLSALATGGSGQYEYRFWIYGPLTNNSWKVIREWDTSSTYYWTTPSVKGTYSLGVWAKNRGDDDSRFIYKGLFNYEIR